MPPLSVRHSPTRRAKPDYREWEPHAYQQRAVEHLCGSGAAALFLDPGLGKEMPLPTRVYTPSGWRRIGDLATGDYVYGADGRPTMVEGVFPQGLKRVYRVSFGDGTSTLCGLEHLWTVAATNWSAQRPLSNARAWQTLTTRQIMERGVLRPKADGRRGAYWRIPIAAPVQHPHVNLPIEPHLFGAWLSNGYKNQLTVCLLDADLEERARNALGADRRSKRVAPGCWQIGASVEWGRRASALVGGELSKGKFIPEQYMRASVDQRVELLRGLMDTDGSAQNNRITFHTCSERLGKDVAELVRSLGGVAVERRYARSIEGKPVEWQINVKTTFCPFHTARKAAQWWPHKLARIITDITVMDEVVEQVCILVRNPLHLYLANDFIVTHNTSIVLESFRRLKERGIAKRMLVVAPLRVCQSVWRQEGVKWTQFRDLRFSLLHGAKKRARLADDADIWLINPEGVAWLAKLYMGRPLPFDTVVIDELTKFKNARAERHKALRPRISQAARRWGLTGTPAPNGYMDLFGQFLILDDGAALGKYITHYRDTYFSLGYDGFTYNLAPGAGQRVEERVRPYVLRMSADDYLEMPPLIDDVRLLGIEPGPRKVYEQMKQDMITELPEGVVTGANAAAVYSKLAQMANGAVYTGPDKAVALIHDTKLEALEELIEELAGQPLLLAYEFRHDLERLRKHFGAETPYIGSGVGEADATRIMAAWNRNEIPLLLAHPASTGHGLNLQEGAAAHICWFSPTWDFELYDQFIRRVRRQGNDAQRIFNHLLVARGTVDELKLEALKVKDTTQGRLLNALNAEILRDADNPATVSAVAPYEENEMVTKLPRQGGETSAPITPRGWAKAVIVQDPDDVEEEAPTQRERIASKLRGDPEMTPNKSPARGAFSAAIQKQRQTMAEPTDEVEEEPPFDKPTRVEREDPEPTPEPDPAPKKRRRSREEMEAARQEPATANAPTQSSDQWLRVKLLEMALAFAPDADEESILAIASQFRDFVEG